MPDTTIVFDTYWRFAAERLAVYLRRVRGEPGPWTEDAVIASYRFTNTYRIADRVSQYLVREVQYRADRSQAPAEIFFRTLLFKLFNRIETWELLEAQHGPIAWQSADMEGIGRTLDAAMSAGMRLYSAAYIMPVPPFGHARKHRNHLALLDRMMKDGLAGRIVGAGDLSEVYSLLLGQPGIGPFLAFQYAIDLNYSAMLDFDEGSFVVAGPGALDGIAKCFSDGPSLDSATVIHRMADEQERHFERLGLEFPGLFGRPLQPIDCQNLFCEISKYARVAHPDVAGSSGRTRIKQNYSAGGGLDPPFLPPRWGIDPGAHHAPVVSGQPRLL
ncbi:MAG: nucleotide kinase domain-containing protein [Sphingomonas pseudosanguinis]|uniref:nucleotide kinase domain-containing protein n=1 Tax=Sphingomonas pseudosanguinis TaxID=413712 RepID=UPI00391B6BB4